MDFKMFGKDKAGGVALLLLVILISQGRMFELLVDTALGRAILVGFLILISYLNKILGVVSVLFIIIAFSNSGIMEGMETKDSKIHHDEKKKSHEKKTADMEKKKDQQVVQKEAETPTEPQVPKQPAGKEGFDLVGKDRMSKNSNSIPVPKRPVESFEQFTPYEGSAETYSAF